MCWLWSDLSPHPSFLNLSLLQETHGLANKMTPLPWSDKRSGAKCAHAQTTRRLCVPETFGRCLVPLSCLLCMCGGSISGTWVHPVCPEHSLLFYRSFSPSPSILLSKSKANLRLHELFCQRSNISKKKHTDPESRLPHNEHINL